MLSLNIIYNVLNVVYNRNLVICIKEINVFSIEFFIIATEDDEFKDRAGCIKVS